MKVLGNGETGTEFKVCESACLDNPDICSIPADDGRCRTGAHASEQTGHAVFQQAQTDFDKLVSVKNASRQSWLAVARKFRSVHKRFGGQESRLSLYYSGRAFY